MTFALGQPCWIDLQVRDAPQREALMSFFFGAFGWTGEVGPAETGYYTQMSKDGEVTAALGQIDQGGMAWVTYLHTDDIQDTARRITQHGGQVVAGPMQVMEFGQLAIAIDPVGALFGLWQPGNFEGFAASIAPGHAVWFDQGSPDPATAMNFYRDVFDLTVNGGPDGGMLGRGERFYFSCSRNVDGVPADWKPVIMVQSLPDLEGFITAAGGTIYASQVVLPTGGTATTFADPVAGAALIAFNAGNAH